MTQLITALTIIAFVIILDGRYSGCQIIRYLNVDTNGFIVN